MIAIGFLKSSLTYGTKVRMEVDSTWYWFISLISHSQYPWKQRVLCRIV
jgi:hypothetical protein